MEASITPEEKLVLDNYLKEIIDLCPRCKEEKSKELIYTAYNIAYKAHETSRRKSGEPFLFHPLRVARICVEEIGLGVTSVICALLHDVIEDADYSIEDIQKLFGETIAKIVDGLTKIKKVLDDQNSSINKETFKKILLAMSDDARVILIKLADRLDNMRTLSALPPYKKNRIIMETLYFYAPLAHRLGLYKIKTELEDLSLKYQHPDVYEKIKQQIEETERARQEFINEFCAPIKEKLDTLNIKYSITSRIKSIYSIYNKMIRKNVPFEEIYDLFAIRIIFEPIETMSEKALCWQIYSLVTDIYTPNPDRLRDWVSSPKSNGYEALHTTVMSRKGKWVEVQIRSTRMDEIAEKGYAAHWKYKDGSEETELEKWFKRIREILESGAELATEFIDEIKLFTDEIFVFTPKGELRRLPAGSTVLDFAYDIHTEIGDHAIGAKVNYHLVPLNYKLKSGDQVEVLTSEIQQPEEEWLKFVVTTKARVRINEKFKMLKKERIERGKKLLDQKLKELGYPIDGTTYKKLYRGYNVTSKELLHLKIGSGEILLDDLDKIMKKKRKNKWLRFWKIQIAKTANRLTLKKTDEKKDITPIDKKQIYQIKDIEKNEGIKTIRSKCCMPLPGDQVIGYLAEPNVIEVHKKDCPIAIKKIANNGSKAVMLEWVPEKRLTYLVQIKLSGNDRMGLANEITNLLSNEMEINMRTIHLEATDGRFTGYIELYIHDSYNLKELIKKLKDIKGIGQVVKVENPQEDNEEVL
ncbi:MAG: RelA/SpoT family protein [Bacteroidales bacterium]|nr:RelA/SpoT family protein [Bacteroidales bacterium]